MVDANVAFGRYSSGMRKHHLVVEHLDKQLPFAGGSLLILQDISFCVAAGESMAIVGSSGSGKSTLLGLLAGLDVVSGGGVWLLEHELARLSEDARAALRARHVGFVFQQFQLLSALTAIEQVMLPLELSGASNARARALAMLESVGLAERLTHYPKQLSGGEQQRVALARAFVAQPKILFADEPTGSLDSQTGESIAELMFRMNANAGTTLILVTHEARLAARCDRQIRLNAGRLVFDSALDGTEAAQSNAPATAPR
jgi:putative ABC transport system ATP-binding protein